MTDAFLAYTKTRGAFGLVRVRMLANITRQRNPVNPCRGLMSCQTRLQPPQPTRYGGDTHAKPSRHPGYRKPFLLPNRQNFAAKIQ